MNKHDERNLWATVEEMLTESDRETMNLRPETDPCLWFLRICEGFRAMREQLVALGYDWEYVRGVHEHDPVPEAIELAREVYSGHAAGCCLHVLLDDGNTSDGDAHFCYGVASGREHSVCATLANKLTLMREEQRIAVRRAIYPDAES